MNKLYKNWSLLTLSNIVYQGLFFLSFVKIARLFKPELYGIFTVIITSTQMAQIFSALGLQKITIREIARDYNKQYIVAKLTLLPTIIASLISAIFLVVYLFIFENINESFTLIVSAIIFVSLMVWNYAEPLAFGKQQMKISANINIVSSCIFTAMVFFIPSAYLSFYTVIAIYCGIFLIRALVYIILEWKDGYFIKTADAHQEGITVKYLLAKSLAFYGTTLLSIPIVQLPVLFLSQFSGEKEVGYFGIINKLSMPLSLIANNLFTALYPVLAKHFVDDKNAFKEKTTKLFCLLSISGIVLSAFLGFFSKEVVGIVLGNLYLPATKTFSIQVWATLLIIQNTFIGTIFLATDEEKLMVKLSVLNSILIGSACYIGAYYGSFGLSLSMWGSLALGFIPHWYFMTKRVNLRFEPRLVSFLSLYFLAFSIVSISLTGFPLAYRIPIFLMVSVVVYLTLKKYFVSDVIFAFNYIRNYFKKKYLTIAD
ncbi:MAG: oligosaccharide flippase family protein [Ignavibacteria bacterium]|nr:oligosaccharide flippase family protein [Ignavibacteria bacterium]MCU7503124.1 oligosaccharide flippase family protein [Ignavibacteria bacterium]MCU7518420.1 oligosaccharide flippase family protein [Ignavibacteria bacterium]